MRRVAVVGTGAVGGYFGGMLARAGVPVVLIGRQAFVDAVTERGLFLDTVSFRERLRVEAVTDPGACRGAELVLFCVKTRDTVKTAREIAPFLSSDAIVLSLQNGVENVHQIREATGVVDTIATAVYVAVSTPEPGVVKHVGRGDLVIGPDRTATRSAAEVLRQAAVPCRVSNDIEGELWSKLLWNCALNAVSAVGRARYREIARNEDARKLVTTVVDECMAVARAAGVRLAGVDDAQAGFAGAIKIATDMAEQMSSTAQDLLRGRLTEIESLNGYIVRRGAELSVPTPVNHALYTLVKLLEDGLVFCGAAD